jgi:hypothetical protein
MKGINWIYLPQNTDSWRALLNYVMNIRVSQNAANFLTSRGSVKLLWKDCAPKSYLVNLLAS